MLNIDISPSGTNICINIKARREPEQYQSKYRKVYCLNQSESLAFITTNGKEKQDNYFLKMQWHGNEYEQQILQKIKTKVYIQTYHYILLCNWSLCGRNASESYKMKQKFNISLLLCIILNTTLHYLTCSPVP